MLLSKFMYFIHLHHICGINRETGVSQGSRSQSRQDTPSVTANMSSLFYILYGYFDEKKNPGYHLSWDRVSRQSRRL